MNSNRTRSIIGAILTAILGSVLHFAYEFSGDNILVGLFTSINESTWEHLKLLAFPFLLFELFEFFIFSKNESGFWTGRLLALLAGMGTIVGAFYIYTGILGYNYFIIDILIFFLSVAVAYYLSYIWSKQGTFSNGKYESVAIILIGVLIALFFIFTVFPPSIGLFISPVSNGFMTITSV